ncbi:uncharacterized protein LOC125011824 [Mugil cephalus]|uniref:uncharacterized protein LOC125011824 n=1 Tax=Mugil cephalus TaxID=48193 RepID=UPI001FB62DBB|nr:uncharacterized protein LOC125011824 [Mugil cephalus]
MNPPMIISTSSVSTTKRKREAERSVNWTAEETQVLLCAWSDERVQKSLAENLRNRHVFKHLSARMSEMGFCRSPHQCRLRVKTLKANYVRAKLQRNFGSSQPCSFKYFAEMDAVLGRRSVGEDGGLRFISGDGMADHHFDSMDGMRSIALDLNSNAEVGGHHFGSSESEGRQRLSSLEERTGCHLDSSEVKLEDRQESTEEFEFSDTGFSPHPRNRHHKVYLETTIHPESNGTIVENGFSTPSPHVAASLPADADALPPPVAQPIASPTPLVPPHESPSDLPATARRLPESSSLEPALKHLSECFQRLVSETRDLLVQLESQRHDHARWHQDLLAQWLQREERQQRETAEREERREKARMEHEIRVLELLASLSRQQGCRCRDNQNLSEALTAPSHTTNKDGH